VGLDGTGRVPGSLVEMVIMANYGLLALPGTLADRTAYGSSS
jgi:hypothetical protein